MPVHRLVGVPSRRVGPTGAASPVGPDCARTPRCFGARLLLRGFQGGDLLRQSLGTLSGVVVVRIDRRCRAHEQPCGTHPALRRAMAEERLWLPQRGGVSVCGADVDRGPNPAVAETSGAGLPVSRNRSPSVRPSRSAITGPGRGLNGYRQCSIAARLECDEATVWRACERYRQGGLASLFADGRQGNAGRPQQISPVQRAQIVELACLEPIAKGLHITHWSSEDLARQAVDDKIIPAISAATVRRILQDVDLQPHRTRYWKTARLDARFTERAEQVLWCYGNADRLAQQGIWVVCVDEIPTFQVLERHPIRRAVPGSIEQQEFDYTRHGTVNMLVFLVVHTGLMELVFLAENDHEHYLPELELFHKQHKELQG